ncbi:hypothetical protein SAMN04487936_112108 [Halobacillus dabanensis]|uniref:Uncharacterized protein n=1 Tax=Halobacillus dabanensis TaxID=240302 RepID=A0A1I3Z321_HALDA|nr:hypothetical protein [Halobacillus dabanensis]SFK38061.1 hypothetical protein SAMN04487936_112108 [Halobacillus dabanensis]
MSDLIDRKLKKVNKDVKYDEVPFDQRHMHKSILQSLRRKPKKKAIWIKKSSPLPIAAILLFSGLHFSQTEPNTETAGLMTERIPAPELKTATVQPGTSSAKQTSTHHTNTSMMVRETYVIHEKKHFIQTGKRVTTEELGEVIGTVEHQPSNESLESVARFLPETKIYKIKGEETKDRIAVQSWRSNGIGSTSVSRQGYFVFEKSPAMPQEDS